MKKGFYSDLPARSRWVILVIGISYFALVMGILLMARAAMADTQAPLPSVPYDAIEGGGFFLATADETRLLQAPLLSTDVQIDVSGPVVRVKVLQTFQNPTSYWLEGIYTFPLPEKAAVDRLTLIVGGRKVKAEIQEKEQAQKTYEAAKAAGQRASLITQERSNIFTNAVANIGPGETISVEIEYQDNARFLDGAFSLRFPMVVRPRYIPGNPLPMTPSGTGWSYDSDQVRDASRITPPIADPRNGPINPVSIAVNLDPGFVLDAVSSPSHAITVKEQRNHYEISLTDGTTVPADSDFVLSWHPMPGGTPLAGSFTEKIDGDYYHLFIVIPRTEEANVENAVLPREVIFIIDVSGSMGGEAIRQAKAALLKALDGLKPTDKFNVIAFNNTAHKFFPAAVEANQRSLSDAHGYVSRLYADGGTEMASALNLALNGAVGLEYLRQIIFITDGSVGNEEYLLEMIHKGLGDSRLFTIGIGSAPNSYFMREAAAMGKGTFTYIGSEAEVDEKMHALFRKLETPLLKDISISLPSSAEMFPAQIPDLYDGEPVLITVKTPTRLKGDISLSGSLAGAGWNQTLARQKKNDNAGIAALWARNKIREISNQAIRAGTVYMDETRNAIVEVALKHQLVSKYTSLVAVDEEIVRVGADLNTTSVPTNLPKDMDPGFVTGQGVAAAPPAPAFQLREQFSPSKQTLNLPQTSTGLWQKILLGLMLLLCGFFLLQSTRKKAGEIPF